MAECQERRHGWGQGRLINGRPWFMGDGQESLPRHQRKVQMDSQGSGEKE